MAGVQAAGEVAIIASIGPVNEFDQAAALLALQQEGIGMPDELTELISLPDSPSLAQ